MKPIVVDYRGKSLTHKNRNYYIKIGEGLSARFVHKDGTIQSYCGESGWYKNREEVRQAIQAYKKAGDPGEIRSASLYLYDMYICFFILGDRGFYLSGSEPANDRTIDKTLVEVGKVLQKYGVGDYKVYDRRSD